MLRSYPFDEFIRDFKVICRHADEPGIREYAKKTYANSGVAIDRSVTLQMVCSYLNRNLDAINVGKIAVTSDIAGCLLSSHLMRAIHEEIVPRCLGATGEFPPATELVKLAESYENKPST